MYKNIAGCVVLYDPTEAVLENIKTYSNSVDKVYIVDNTENAGKRLKDDQLNQIRNAVYISLKTNSGIAHALNIAASNALKDDYEWLLMMDQDSSASTGMVGKLYDITDTIAKEQIGIIAPTYLDDAASASAQKVEEVFSVITSGSILNLLAYKQVGPFRDDLFIDFVDHEYCLRLRQAGFKIIINHEVKLNHQLGNLTCHNFMGWKLCTSNHNYLRRYYITRNRLEILQQFKKEFPEFLATEKHKNFVEIVKMLFFEKDKLRKAKSVMLGYLDYKRRRFGKYRYN